MEASPSVASQSAQGPAASAANLAIKIFGSDNKEAAVGPDGKRHDSYVPSNLSLKAGVPVTIQLQNMDEMMHSFTVPELGINQMVPGGKDDAPGVGTLTFTPTKTGTFHFLCTVPCDEHNNGWAMTPSDHGPAQDGFMAGHLTVS
ncbi:MAG: cupredoxin domain-containing protein [Chloroflexota bacterium]|nr:cupredoxin domain-containing protein [Chloroflexota bacterium]